MSIHLTRLRRVARIQARAAANALARRARERSRETSHGPYSFRFPSRSIVGRAVAEGLGWDRHLLGAIDRLPPGALVCEVGSNIGASLLTMAAARDDLRFVCFEPSNRFLPYLRENVASNDLARRVSIEPLLVGPDGETWELTSNTSTGSVVAGQYDTHIPLETQRATAVSLDDYFVGRSEQPAFVKIDTDGFELQVLRSAERLLARHKPDLFVEYTPALLERVGDDGGALREYLSSAGYSSADIYRGDGELLELDHDLGTPIETSDYVDLIVRGGRA